MGRTKEALKDERGMVLISAMFVLALLIIFGTISIGTTVDELRIAGNDKRNRLAFYLAESGIEYARAMIRLGFENAPVKSDFVDDFVGSPPDFSAPTDYDFTVVPDGAGGTGTAEDPYFFVVTSTGRGQAGALETVEVRFDLKIDDPPIKYGVFGNVEVRLKQNCQMVSYDSATMPPNPDSLDSTGEGDIFSNSEVAIGNGVWIDGEVSAGLSVTLGSGAAAASAPVNGASLENNDPLGLIDPGGLLDFNDAVAVNNNAHPSISGFIDGALKLTINEAVHFPAGDYYFTGIDLGNGAKITIGGEVNFYLDGPLITGSDTEINVSGLPTDFSIYSRSIDPLLFWNTVDMRGLIYAPDAEVEFKNSLTYYGAIYGRKVITKNDTTVWYDSAMAMKFSNSSSIPLKVAYWRRQ